MKPSQLKSYLFVCRQYGVSSIEFEGIKITFNPSQDIPQPHGLDPRACKCVTEPVIEPASPEAPLDDKQKYIDGLTLMLSHTGASKSQIEKLASKLQANKSEV